METPLYDLLVEMICDPERLEPILTTEELLAQRPTRL